MARPSGRSWRSPSCSAALKSAPMLLKSHDSMKHFAHVGHERLRLQHHDVRAVLGAVRASTSARSRSRSPGAITSLMWTLPSRSATASARSSRTGRRRLRRAQSTRTSCSSPASPRPRVPRLEGLGLGEGEAVGRRDQGALVVQVRQADVAGAGLFCFYGFPLLAHLRQLRRVLRPRRADGGLHSARQLHAVVLFNNIGLASIQRRAAARDRHDRPEGRGHRLPRVALVFARS